MSDTSERELLELAAKAAGIDAVWDGYRFLVGSGDSLRIWNPRTDDGDALRLAVKLRIAVNQTKLRAFAVTYNERAFDEPLGNDPYAATRLAIVRAAAAIGKEMK